MSEVQRIANLVQPGIEAHTYMHVPEAAVSPGFSSELFELTMPVGFLGELDRAMAGLSFTEAGVRAERAGFSAVIINAFGDYGISTLRSAATIPVVGAGQAALQTALTLGQRFGILTVWPPQMAPTYAKLIAENGFASRYTGVRFVTTDEELPDQLARGPFGLRLASEPETLIDRIELAGRQMLDEGADVIVAGCVCMVPIVDELEGRLGVPVVNPLTAAHAHAEMLVRLGVRPHLEPISDAQLRVLGAMVTGGAGAPAYAPAEECGDACAVPVVSAAQTQLVGA